MNNIKIAVNNFRQVFKTKPVLISGSIQETGKYLSLQQSLQNECLISREYDWYKPHDTSSIVNIKKFIKACAPDYQEIIVFALDAIKYDLFVSALEKNSNLKGSAAIGVLTSVFPSTTGTAWPSIITGVVPSIHGVLGTSFLLEKYNKNYIWISNSLNHKGERQQLTLQDNIKLNLSGETTIFEDLGKIGFDSYYIGTHASNEYNPFRAELTKGAVHKEPLIDGYLEMIMNPMQLLNYFKTRNDKTINEHDTEKRKALIWNYINLDDYIHEKGYTALNASDFWKNLFDYINTLKKDGRLILLFSDHGQTKQTILSTNILKESSENPDLEFNTGGAGRVLYFYPRKGREEAVRNWLEKKVNNNGKIFSKEELIENGLLIPNKALNRMGDLIAVAFSDDFPSTGANSYISEHGSLTAAEMFVPFLIY